MSKAVSFKHSGNLGDVLYALPAILGYRDLRPGLEETQLLLKPGVPTRYSGAHPLGNLLLTEAYIDRIKPLLEYQTYIDSVAVHQGEAVDVDLDDFRKLPISFKTGCIPYWYFWLLGCSYDLSRSWIEAVPDEQFAGFVIVSRTFRLRSKFIDYSFLDRFASRIIFCGVKDEWDDFRRGCPAARNWVQFEDFLQYARALKASIGFIGNQGFGFTLSESMKIPRVLESNEVAPNNSPIGGWFRSCLFQKHFEAACQTLFDPR